MPRFPGPDDVSVKRQGLYPCESEIARRLSLSDKVRRRTHHERG